LSVGCAVGQTHSLPSFGLCGWLERLGNVCGCMAGSYSFLGSTKILKKSFDIFKKQYTEPVIIGSTK